MSDRAPVDFTMDRMRCHVGAFEAAWDAMAPAHKRVLVLRCGGLSLKEVALHLGITHYTMKEYAKRVMETMRAATGESDFLALCWLYGYSRALQDIDEQVMRKKRVT